MLDHRPDRLPAQAPTVTPPPPFAERRVTYRRAADQQAHDEKVLLARALDILAADTDAETRLAGLLRLLARIAGAQRAAVLADGIERRTAVAIDPGEDPAAGEALAAWLDAGSDRSRARRAAAGRAPISVVVAQPGLDAQLPADGSEMVSDVSDDDPTPQAVETGAPHYAMLPIPSAGHVVLGFEFRRRADVGRLADRLPPQLARHAAVVLALVTEELATEREVASLRAREAERARFVSTVAHELRTPLTGLRGYLELILDGRVDDPTVERDFLERSRGIVASMNELVGDLLELSRLESGTLELELEPFSVAEAGSQVAAGLLPIALERQIRLRTAFPPRLQAATGDRRRVEQILTNLVGNALKFTQPGGSVDLEGRFDGSVAVFLVRDDGPGIAADDRSRIFERFHRLAAHVRVTGTGLGLPIARDLARRMGGDLDVASVPGSGSAFVLVLPGPTSVDGRAMQTALSETLGGEEVALEERAVLRAMAAAGRMPSRVGLGGPEGGGMEPAGGPRPRIGGPRHGASPRGLRVLDSSDSGDPTPA